MTRDNYCYGYEFCGGGGGLFVGGGSVFGDCGAVSTDGGFQKSFHLLIILEVCMAHLSRKDHGKNAIVIGMHF